MGSLAASIIALILIFQNCGGFKVSQEFGSAPPPVFFFHSSPGTSRTNTYNYSASLQALDYSYKTGTLAQDCLANSSYDVCIFLKNPFVTGLQMGRPLIEPPLGDALSDLEIQNQQVFGVSLSPWVTNNELKNTHFEVIYSDTGGLPQRLTLQNNAWKRSFAEGHSPATPFNERFAIEQIQTFFYLNLFRDMMVQDGGAFRASDKAILVNAVTSFAGYNAYFDPPNNSILMGVRFGQNGRYYPLALSADLLIRQAAFANFREANVTLQQATPSAVYVLDCKLPASPQYFVTDSSYLTTAEGEVLAQMLADCGHNRITSPQAVPYCPTDAGCWRAIEEGQADFFTYVFFSRWPSIGELSLSSDLSRYWQKRSNIKRADVASNFGFSYYDSFERQHVTAPADVKKMGEVYADILFNIYTDASVDRLVFLKTVVSHIEQIGSATTFVDAKNLLMAIDDAVHAGRNKTRIEFHFNERGF